MAEFKSGEPAQNHATNGRTSSQRSSSLAHRISSLVEAYDYTRDLDCDVWEFAVEIAALHADGLSDSDLRWLICSGFVKHAGETTFTGERRRSFRQIEGLKFFEQSCFVLTEIGREFGSQSFVTTDRSDGMNGKIVGVRNGNSQLIPHWDSDRNELLVQDIVVKRFKLPAPNQEAILMAFEEERWKERIDDPIPPTVEQDQKQRLRDTIKSLNRNQKQRLIRFTCDGRGQGVLWELVGCSVVVGDRQR